MKEQAGGRHAPVCVKIEYVVKREIKNKVWNDMSKVFIMYNTWHHMASSWMPAR